MAANAEAKEILAGIRLLIEEQREQRQSQHKRDEAFREEQRKRDEAWREEVRERDAKFMDVVKRFDAREEDLHRALIVIGNVGKRILQSQEKHTKLLEKILGALTARGNGKHRSNGH